MHDGQTVRIEYQDGTPETPLVREVPLKGFARMLDECSALERRYDEQEARATPDTQADITLLCDGQTVQVWFNPTCAGSGVQSGQIKGLAQKSPLHLWSWFRH